MKDTRKKSFVGLVNGILLAIVLALVSLIGLPSFLTQPLADAIMKDKDVRLEVACLRYLPGQGLVLEGCRLYHPKKGPESRLVFKVARAGITFSILETIKTRTLIIDSLDLFSPWAQLLYNQKQGVLYPWIYLSSPPSPFPSSRPFIRLKQLKVKAGTVEYIHKRVGGDSTLTLQEICSEVMFTSSRAINFLCTASVPELNARFLSASGAIDFASRGFQVRLFSPSLRPDTAIGCLGSSLGSYLSSSPAKMHLTIYRRGKSAGVAGLVELEGACLKGSRYLAQCRDLKGVITFDQANIAWEKGEGKFFGFPFKTEGQLKDWRQDPYLSLVVSMDNIQLGRFKELSARSPSFKKDDTASFSLRLEKRLREPLVALAGDFRCQAPYLLVAEGKAEGEFRGTSDITVNIFLSRLQAGAFDLGEGQILLSAREKRRGEVIFKLVPREGEVSGALEIDYNERPVYLFLDSQIRNVRLEDVVREDKEGSLSGLKGKTTSRLQLVMRGSDMDSLMGKADLDIKEGHFWDASFFRKLFIFLGISKCWPQQTAHGSFLVKDKQITIENLAICDKELRFLIRGHLGFKGELELGIILGLIPPHLGFASKLAETVSSLISFAGHFVTEVKVSGELHNPRMSLSPLPLKQILQQDLISPLRALFKEKNE